MLRRTPRQGAPQATKSLCTSVQVNWRSQQADQIFCGALDCSCSPSRRVQSLVNSWISHLRVYVDVTCKTATLSYNLSSKSNTASKCHGCQPVTRTVRRTCKPIYGFCRAEPRTERWLHRCSGLLRSQISFALAGPS